MEPHREINDAQGKKIFHNYTRITGETFMFLLRSIEDRITKINNRMRAAIPAGLKLACTCGFWLQETVFIPWATTSVLPTTRYPSSSLRCWRLCWIFCGTRSSLLSTGLRAEKKIAEKFKTMWQFPHCLGAIDGKHIRVKKPALSGALYHNYKGYFSIPLLAVDDADYRFLWVNVGGVGHMSDSQIFLQSDLYHSLDGGTFPRPAPCPLTNAPEDTLNIPYYLVGDEAFALKDYLMKPFPRGDWIPGKGCSTIGCPGPDGSLRTPLGSWP